MKQFNREVLEVDEAEDKVQLTMFKASLKSKEFVVALAKSPLESMAKLLLKTLKYMNTKDVLVAIRVEGTQKDKRDTKKDTKGKERNRKDHSSSHDNVKPWNDKTRRMVKFKTPVMPVDKILM